MKALSGHGTHRVSRVYGLAIPASREAGNRSMRAAGRTDWNRDDWNAAVEALRALYPGEEDGEIQGEATR